MYEQVDKPKEKKSRANANSVTQKKSKVKQEFGFVDNQTVTIAKRKIQGMDRNCSQQRRPIQKVENIRKQTDNLKPAHLQKNIIQRKIGDFDNIIFGLDGKNKEAIKNAVNAGYRVFDGADSYGNTINLLAEVLEEERKDRSEYEIIYKVSETKPDILTNHLLTIARRFGGYLDYVLIHKAPDQYASQHSTIIKLLKESGKIKHIGMGDARVDKDEDFESFDSFEIDANAILVASDADDLIEKLNGTDKPVFVYNILSTLTKILNIEVDNLTSTKLSAFLTMIRGKIPKAEPILSSSDKNRIESNMTAYNYKEGEERQVFNEINDIKKAISSMTRGVPINKMEEDIKLKINEIMFLQDWRSNGLWESQDTCDHELEEKMKLFKTDQLRIKYEGLGNDKGKSFTLKELLKMLYTYTGNCKRVEALNFLNGMFD